MRLLAAAKVILTLGITLSPVSGAAQNCAALSFVYDVSQTKNYTDMAASYRNLLCQQNFQSKSKARSFVKNMGLPVEGGLLEMGSNVGEEKFGQSYSQFCGGLSYKRDFRKSTEEHVRAVNPDIVEALDQCHSTQGIHAWIVQTSSPQKFSINFKYIPTGFENFLKLGPLSIDGAACDQSLTNGLEIPPNETVTTICTREPVNSAVVGAVISLETVGNQVANFSLPKIERRLALPSCKFEVVEVRKKSCEEGFKYVGPIDAEAHGGQCIRMNGCKFSLQGVRTESCANSTYLGPRDAAAHGGNCLKLFDRRFIISTRAIIGDEQCDPETEQYLGPSDHRALGGHCVSLSKRNNL